MSDFSQTLPSAESFHASNQSQTGKVRKGLWFAMVISVVTAAVSSKSTFAFFLTIGIVGALIAAVDYILRKQINSEKSLVAIKTSGIECANFSGKQKSFRWSDIQGVSVENIGNAVVLQLQLHLKPGLKDKRNFWNGTNGARPYIALAPYSTPDQERILELSLQHLRQSQPNHDTTNTLVQEREFQAQLIALAPYTWVTYALVFINVTVWLLMLINGANFIQPSVEMLFRWGGNTASEVQHGQWWRMITATFLHSGFMHITMNMLGLWSIGQTVERIYGHRAYLLIYLGSALAGSALSLHFSAQKAVSVGASGAVFGIAGALLVAVYQHRDTLPKIFGKQNLTGIGAFVVYSLAQGFAHAGIDNGAHIGGLLAGAAIAFVLPERFDLQHYEATIRHRGMIALTVAGIFITTLAVSAPTAQVDFQRQLSGEKAFADAINSYQDAAKLLQSLHTQQKNGQITELELDAKSRTDIAPAYRKILSQLEVAWFPPQDPRNEMLLEMRHMTKLLIEVLEMESVVRHGTTTPEPVDLARSAVLTDEIRRSSERIAAIGQKFKQLTKSKNGL